jgi:hypothetical protein
MWSVKMHRFGAAPSYAKLLVEAHLLIYVSVKYALSKFVLYLFYCSLGRPQIIAYGTGSGGVFAAISQLEKLVWEIL